MSVKRLGRFGAAVLAPAAILAVGPGTRSFAAGACPDIEVIFARGTGGSGLGNAGNSFVDALLSKVGNRSLETYSVRCF